MEGKGITLVLVWYMPWGIQSKCGCCAQSSYLDDPMATELIELMFQDLWSKPVYVNNTLKLPYLVTNVRLINVISYEPLLSDLTKCKDAFDLLVTISGLVSVPNLEALDCFEVSG